MLGNLVPEVLKIILGKKALAHISPEISPLKAGEYPFHLLKVVLEGPITDNQCVINVGAGAVRITEHVGHDFLENVWTIFDTHGK